MWLLFPQSLLMHASRKRIYVSCLVMLRKKFEVPTLPTTRQPRTNLQSSVTKGTMYPNGKPS